MFEELADRIENLDVAPRAQAVEALGGLHSKLSAKLTLSLSALEGSGDWALDGSVTLTAWVRNHLGLTNQAAHRMVKAARRLRRLPVTADAWLAGSLSSGQVEVIVAHASDARIELLGQHEAALVPTLVPLDVAQTTRALRHWAAHADAILDGAKPAQESAAEAQLVQTLDGRAYLRGSFDAQGHEIIATGLALADCGDRELSRSQRQGQAMVDVFAGSWTTKTTSPPSATART